MRDPESAVRERYSAAAQEREAALCCPVDYDPRLLEVIPAEVLERDYGCGDPSRHLREGDEVLDLGSGGGKICFIASQIVGPKGRVIGVDVNPDMLELARRSAPVVAERLGFSNVEFRRGFIQDLALDLDRVDERLGERPVATSEALARLEAELDGLRGESPLVADASVDVVVSNCVLNLVREADRDRLIAGIHRVLKPGGRFALSDIVSDEVVPAHLKADPELWSGCVSGAFHEAELVARLESAGFHGVEIASWEPEPFAVVEGITFRSVTVTGRKHAAAEEGDAARGHVLYRGPWRRVEDDEGNVLRRGERTEVAGRSLRRLAEPPYAGEVVALGEQGAGGTRGAPAGRGGSCCG